MKVRPALVLQFTCIARIPCSTSMVRTSWVLPQGSTPFWRTGELRQFRWCWAHRSFSGYGGCGSARCSRRRLPVHL